MSETARNLTAVICTRNRSDRLHRALNSLSRMDPPAAAVIVVDNAPSSDETRQVVRENFPTVRYVLEPVAGLDFARNRAIQICDTPLLAFLDDDAVADTAWAGQLNRAFQDQPRLAVVTGRIEPLVLETPAQRLFEDNGGFSRGPKPVRLPGDARRALHGFRAPLIAWAISIGCGCSFAIRRTIAMNLGGFDEALDMSPDLPGGGDLDMLWRMLDAGYEAVYAPDVLAWHEHRRRMDEVHDQITGHQRALLAFLAKSSRQASASARPAIATFMAWRLFKPGLRLVRSLLGRDPLPPSVLTRIWWNCWSGVFSYSRACRTARRRAELSATTP